MYGMCAGTGADARRLIQAHRHAGPTHVFAKVLHACTHAQTDTCACTCLLNAGPATVVAQVECVDMCVPA